MDPTALSPPSAVPAVATEPLGPGPAPLAARTMLCDGRYVVGGVLGRGGFAITYEAVDARLRRRVAIKELVPGGSWRQGAEVVVAPDAREAARAGRERFGREARALARFSHPGVVHVYEVFEANGTVYLVMERLVGRTLLEVLQAGQVPFSEDEVLDVAARVAAALRPVHGADILHRDLNPSNVMVTEHGRLVLIDFGLARAFVPDQTVAMTRVLTPGYAPLEQYQGEARFGPAADVYGLAATCYRLATGRIPTPAFERAGGAELVSVHRLNPAISKRVSDAIGDGLEMDPGHRPQDLDSFLARLAIRGLPDTPRSLVLGRPGAEPAELRAADTTHDLLAGLPSSPSEAAGAPSPAGGAVAGDPRLDPTRPVGDGGAAWTVAVGQNGPDPTRPQDGTAKDRTAVPGPGGPDLTRRDQTEAWPGPRAGELAPAPGAAPAPLGLAGGAPGRSKVTVPAAVATVAAASAAPVLIGALVVGMALPVLATLGDGEARRQRRALGVPERWAERSLPGLMLGAVRFVRNLVVTVVRLSPIIGLGALLLAGWYALAGTSAPRGFVDAMLRILGAGAMAAMLGASARGSSRYRSGLGIDVAVRRLVPDGRTTLGVVVGWILAVVVVAGALWLTPDTVPLG